MIFEFRSNLTYFSPLFAENLFDCLAPGSPGAPDFGKFTRKFRKGARIIEAGEMPRRVYRLTSGEVRLDLNTASKEIHISRAAEPNEIIGLTEALLNLPYRISARSVTPCVCEYIPREDLSRFLHERPEISFKLAEILGSNLRNSYKHFILQ